MDTRNFCVFDLREASKARTPANQRSFYKCLQKVPSLAVHCRDVLITRLG